jgi:hypothetical protein
MIVRACRRRAPARVTRHSRPFKSSTSYSTHVFIQKIVKQKRNEPLGLPLMVQFNVRLCHRRIHRRCRPRSQRYPCLVQRHAVSQSLVHTRSIGSATKANVSPGWIGVGKGCRGKRSTQQWMLHVGHGLRRIVDRVRCQRCVRPVELATCFDSSTEFDHKRGKTKCQVSGEKACGQE